MNIDAAVTLAMPLVFDTEGCRLTAWLDTLPTRPVWTVGHGTTWVHGRPVVQGTTCTQAEADQWAATGLIEAGQQIAYGVKVPLDDCQLGALISLVYNIGVGRFKESSVLEALNHGLYQQAADRFLEYDHAGGRRVTGLSTRRARERTLFMTNMLSTPPASREAHASGTTPASREQRASDATISEADALNQREIDTFDPPPAA